VRAQKLRDHADESQLQEEWREVKALAKKKAAARIESLTGVKINPNALFDVQVGPRAAA
jgi:starch phosphorylase